MWQLNSAYHEIIPDCNKQTDRAYEVYKGTGKTFIRWSAYNNGNWKRFETILLAQQQSYLQIELSSLALK